MGDPARESAISAPSGAVSSLESDWEPDEGDLDVDLWCVDVGGTLECLSTRQVWMRLAQGRLSPTTPVWRDGLGHWAPIETIADLTDEGADERVSVPERSEIRARRRPDSLARSAGPSLDEEVSDDAGLDEAPDGSRSRGASLLALVALVGAARKRLAAKLWSAAVRRVLRRSLFALVVLGGLFAGGYGWLKYREGRALVVPRARRVAVDVAERARLLSARGRQSAEEAERSFWGARWQ